MDLIPSQRVQAPHQKWAYSSPVIETGSILMARPGDTFAQRQQYFHKSVVLIIKHDDAGDMGVLSSKRLI